MVDQCNSSVTAQSFVRQPKDSTPLRHEGGWPKREASVRLGFLLLNICLLPPFKHLSPPCLEPALCKLSWPRRKCVVSPVDFLLFYFHGLFPFLSFGSHHFGLLFPILTTYRNVLKKHNYVFRGFFYFKVSLHLKSYFLRLNISVKQYESHMPL